MPSQKLTALVSLAGAQVPTDLLYVADISAGAAGSKSSTFNDAFSIITKNITDGTVRFQGFVPPAVSGAGQGAIYYDSADNRFKISENAGAYANLGNVNGPATATDEALARFDGATGKLLQDSLITLSNAGALTFPDNVRQVFNPGANNAGLNVGAVAGDPAAPINADIWYDSTGNALRARVNGVSVTLGTSVPGGADTQVQYNNNNVFGGVTGATSNGAAITFASNSLIATAPIFITSIEDTNGVPFWNLTATPTAINFLGYANAAAGSSPMWTATGGDTDIGFWVTPKGAGDFRVFDPANPTNLVSMREVMPSGNFPRALFQGGNSAADANWVMRFADFYSSSAQNINVAIQLSTNNDPGYTAAETLMLFSRTTSHAIFSITGVGGNGLPIQITTDVNVGATPNLYCDTVANGNRVGIGTNAPTGQLDVLSAAGARVVVATDANTYFGNGITNAAPSSYVLNGTGGNGTNIAGANLDLAGGKGTGNAIPGMVAVRYSLIGASGTTLQSLSTNRYPLTTSLYTSTGTVTISNTAVETSIFTGMTSSAGSTVSIEGGSARAGSVYRVKAWGNVATTGTPTMQVRTRIGAVVVGNTGAGALANNTNGRFWFEIDIRVAAIGATGSADGFPHFQASTGSGATVVTDLAGGDIGANIDFTAAQNIDVTVTWGTPNIANSITIFGIIIERIR